MATEESCQHPGNGLRNPADWSKAIFTRAAFNHCGPMYCDSLLLSVTAAYDGSEGQANRMLQS